MIKLIKFTICGIILGIVSILVFDLGYIITMLVTSNRNYSVNAGLIANAFIVIGSFIDMSINASSNKKQIIESDLTPKGFKTVAMPDDAKKQIDPNRRQGVENSVQVKNTTSQRKKLLKVKELAKISQNSIH